MSTDNERSTKPVDSGLEQIVASSTAIGYQSAISDVISTLTTLAPVHKPAPGFLLALYDELSKLTKAHG